MTEATWKIDAATIDTTIQSIIAQSAPSDHSAVRQGVEQVALFWRHSDGDSAAFTDFCTQHYLPDAADRTALLHRFAAAMEALNGHEGALTRTLRRPIDLDLGPLMAIDHLLAALNPFDHLSEDLFRSRIAFVALLNFPLYGLQGLLQHGPHFSREQWAAARLTRAFSQRIPGDVRQRLTAAYTAAEAYIAGYNIHMGSVDVDGQALFPDDLILISHWGLRDELKARYAEGAEGLPRQRTILRIMERIIYQEIPAAVIDNPKVRWDPFANTLSPTTDDPSREPDQRYARLLDVFQAERAVDAWSPAYPTFIARRFDLGREIPEEEVEALLISIVADPVAAAVGQRIAQRLGRDLEAFDIWYNGFSPRGLLPEEALSQRVQERFPTAEAFATAIPEILQILGFAPESADFLGRNIEVEAARGAGHAWGAQMRSDLTYLRTRVPSTGLDFKGFNIAMHELGHNVEQVFTLHRVDSTLMAGVPNTAFTEAFAFAFQGRDLQVLNHGQDASGADLDAENLAQILALQHLATYWNAFEIAGVALVDLAVWRQLYANPDMTPAQLRESVVAAAKEVWNRYYAPVFGFNDSPILAIYSHMIAYGLYLPDYPLGYVIQHQLEEHFRTAPLGERMEAICAQGRLTPDAWMRGAVGHPLSTAPLLTATRHAIATLE